MNGRNHPPHARASARLRGGLSAAGRGWNRGCAGASLVLRAIGRDFVTGLALAGASGFHPGWPVSRTGDGGSGAPRRIDRT
ncbi:hypothetical protein [Methylobacterium sp. ID0610]|uniref:hypothetical protein n=1 Tax=Methylobacterium carpenticola TaxID=3344827 RepID=UPI0036B3D10F